MNITPPKPLSSKSTVRSISGLSRTKDLKLTDVTNDDEDGKMMMDDDHDDDVDDDDDDDDDNDDDDELSFILCHDLMVRSYL